MRVCVCVWGGGGGGPALTRSGSRPAGPGNFLHTAELGGVREGVDIISS